MVVFHGAPFQRGYGIGSFFRSLARKAIPFFQQGVKSLGRAALDTGVNIAQDVLRGRKSERLRPVQIPSNGKKSERRSLKSYDISDGKWSKNFKAAARKEKH